MCYPLSKIGGCGASLGGTLRHASKRHSSAQTVRGRHCIVVTLLALLSGVAWAGDQVPDFHLVDVNANSPRCQERVSPRDYLLRISAFYFATAGCSYCRDQFRHLCTLSRELQSNRLPVTIEILGVNRADQATYNFLIPSQGDLPWLQDTNEESVWLKWGAQLRDLWILDSRNRLVSVTNLTTPNLALASHRAALKQVLLSSARLIDSDTDGLPDDWELHHFQDLGHAANEDPDDDGAENLAEYAFGTVPTQAESDRGIVLVRGTKKGQATLFATFRRRGGSALDYRVATSPDLRTWSEDPTLTLITSALRQLYDGSGTAEVTLPLGFSSSPGDEGFLRIQAVAPRAP